ncbi:hypothetical protein HDV02_001766 [Globomyces sp. JEL0801]|nr:hypothetical protein HDV02_001766 [Globomyces sp. JEL0801]
MIYSALFLLVSGAPTSVQYPFSSNPVENFPLFIQYAGASYCERTVVPEAPDFNCGGRCTGDALGTALIKAVNDKSTEGAAFVGYKSSFKLIIVSIRGSYTTKNWLSNVDFGRSIVDWPAIEGFSNIKPFPKNATIHAGFEKTYLSIRKDLQLAIKDAADSFPDYSIVFTGHSMGGSLASIGAVDFINLFGLTYANRVSVYSYGEPRAGNIAWAEYVQSYPHSSRIYRIQRLGDLGNCIHLNGVVIHLPYQWTGYVHSGRQYTLLDDQKTVQTCQTSGPAGESDACLKYDNDKLKISVHLSYYNYRSNKCE